jgi:hypothetical protein
MSGELGTTNLLLGIMAAVSVLEALAIIGMGVAGFTVYRRVMELVAGLETRQVAPAMIRVNAILDDVRDVTAKVRQETSAWTTPFTRPSVGSTTRRSVCVRTCGRKPVAWWASFEVCAWRLNR